VPRALQGGGNHALVFAASPGLVGREDLGMRRHKAADKLRVFIIHERNFLRAE